MAVDLFRHLNTIHHIISSLPGPFPSASIIHQHHYSYIAFLMIFFLLSPLPSSSSLIIFLLMFLILLLTMFNLEFGKSSLTITKANQHHIALELTYSDCCIRTVEGRQSKEGIEFGCLIGIKYIKEVPVLLLGVQAETIFTMGFAKIYEIKRISFIPVAPENQQKDLLSRLGDDLQKMQALFQAGFHYYSDEYDLSLPAVFKWCKTPNHSQRTYYNQFIWNLNLARVDGQKASPEADLFFSWCHKIIQGFARQYSDEVPGGRIRYILITRRSCKKAGTRFYARGIDDQGHVANFAETEQIIYLGEYIFSHLQIRGSVPAFFAQEGVNGLSNGMTIERTLQLTSHAFHLHFTSLAQVYEKTLAINLLSERKSDQQKLIAFFEQLICSSSSSMPELRYQYYDFHQQCKNSKFQNSDCLISDLSDVINVLGYNVFQSKTNTLVQQQKGVVRTNCLDCLDRTNYVQSRIGIRVFKLFIQRYGLQEVSSLSKEGNLLDFPVNERYPLVRGVNQSWADNGDAVSLLYTGIGSTHTDITRTGERTFLGAINHKFRSLSRFFTQFNDHVKHETISRIVTPTVSRQTPPAVSDFSTTLVLSIDNEIPIEEAVEKLEVYSGTTMPSIVVVFVFQRKEKDFFSMMTCYVNAQTTDFEVWEQLVSKDMERQDYLSIGSLMAESCWMGVFCQARVSKHISEVKQENLSKEMRKGEALLLKMKIQHSSFIFAGVNCHSYEAYLKLLDHLHEKGFKISKLGRYKSESFMDLDYRIIVGNTGSEINMPEKELSEIKDKFEDELERKNQKEANRIIHRVLDCDQFGQENHRYLKMYTEAPVHFIPGANRIVFWNAENVILRVREYQDVGRGGVVAVLDYEIGIDRSRRESLSWEGNRGQGRAV